MSAKNNIRAIIRAINQKTGMTFTDLTSAVQEICHGYADKVSGISSSVKNGVFQSGCRISAMISFINNLTGITHSNLTDAVQTLMDGYNVAPSTYLYSFGAVSDTHIQYGNEPDGTLNGVNDLRRALPYLDDKVDFVCICGDLVAWASASYMAEYKSLIEDKTLTTKPIYECSGNHETYPESGVSGEIDKTTWEETTGWANHKANGCVGDSLYYYFTKGNDIFIMLSVVDVAPYATFASGALDWLENVLNSNSNKRCFVFQHIHDENDKTADPSKSYSNMLNGTDGQRFLSILKAHKNAVWFHGHTHLSVATGLDQNGYKTDNSGYRPISTALGYKSVHIPSLQGERYYNPGTNSLQSFYKYYGTDGKTYETQGGTHAEGYIVDVYDNKIVLRTIDFAVLKYTADWKAYYVVEPMADKVFTLRT